MRDSVTTLVELLGFACISVAMFSVAFTAGMLVTGVELVVIGYLTGRR